MARVGVVSWMFLWSGSEGQEGSQDRRCSGGQSLMIVHHILYIGLHCILVLFVMLISVS